MSTTMDPKKTANKNIDPKKKGMSRQQRSMTQLNPQQRNKKLAKSFAPGQDPNGVRVSRQNEKSFQAGFGDEVGALGMKKSKSLRRIGKQQKILPSGFQENVIVKEFEIEKGSVELIDLIELYQSAVEYYDSIGDNTNSSIYQQKIQFVFLKPQISALFMKPKPVPKTINKRSKSPPKILAQKISVASNEQSAESIASPEINRLSSSKKGEDQNYSTTIKRKLGSSERNNSQEKVQPQISQNKSRGRPKKLAGANRRASRSKSIEQIKVLQPQTKDIQNHPFEIPSYTYRNVPSKDALEISNVQQPGNSEEQSLREQLRNFQIKEKQEQQQNYISSEVSYIKQKKVVVRNLLKEDMMKQSDSIKLKLAKRTRNRQARSMQRLDLASSGLGNREQSKPSLDSNMLNQKSSVPKLEFDTSVSLRNKALLTSPKISEADTQKKFQIDKLSKFINIDKLDMIKFKGGEKNFSDILNDVTFIPDPLSAQDKIKTNQQQLSGSQPESNSFEIVDTSQSKTSSKVTPKGSNELKPEKQESSDLSDKFGKSVLSVPLQESGSGSGGKEQNKSSLKGSYGFTTPTNMHILDQDPSESEADDENQQEEQIRIKFELEKSIIDMKYQQQLSALSKKASNPLTKRLIGKVKNEWEQAIEKKKKELNYKNIDSLDFKIS